MANKTLVEKAAERVGYGLAMAEDVAGTVKTAIGSLTEALTITSAKKQAKEPVRKTAGATSAKKAAQKSASKKAPAKKSAARKRPAKKAAPKKPGKKLTSKAAKTTTRTARSRRAIHR